MKRHFSDLQCLVCLHADDFLPGGVPEGIEQVKTSLNEVFNVGRVSHYPLFSTGLSKGYGNNITVSQHNYAEQLQEIRFVDFKTDGAPNRRAAFRSSWCF